MTEPRTDHCPICGARMTTERGYRCFACTREMADEKRGKGEG